MTLAPGRYTLETAALERNGARTSVKRTAFEVPATTPGLALSSVSVIRRAEPLPPDALASGDPFRVEGIRLVPNLDAPIKKSLAPSLSFFAIVYPAAGGPPSRAVLEFWKEGKAVGKTEPELSRPDKEGRVHCVAVVPTASFPPGPYEVRLKVTQGPAEAEERTTLVLEP
jgi:hypothetical protein